MSHLLLLLSGLLTGVLPWGAGAPWETTLDGGQPLESAVVRLNGRSDWLVTEGPILSYPTFQHRCSYNAVLSCREQGLQRVGSTVLQLLRLDRPPQIAAATTSQVREAWAKVTMGLPALSSRGQHLNISSNETLLIQRGSCTQVSHHITLDDLDWGSWVLHPNSFIFTECLGCHCHKKEEGPPLPRWIRECGLGQPSRLLGSGDPKQGRCCRPGQTPLSFAFLREDGSLVLRVIHLDHDCHCRL